MTLRDIKVRKRLHELDRTKSSYPTVARTGDANRKGKYPLIFDDTNTVIFKSSAKVSFPTTLEIGSKYLSNDLTSTFFAGTSNFVSGLVNPSAVDPWLVRQYDAPTFQGFKEDNLHEQVLKIANNEYYQTGSNLTDVGEGFQSSLQSKTIIRIELPLTGISTLNPLTASSYYYDFNTKKFEQVQLNTDTITFGEYDNSLGPGESAVPPLKAENLLFNYLGKHSSILNSNGLYTTTAPEAFPDFFFEAKNGDHINNYTTNPSNNQVLNLKDVINQPFLLEKCVIKVPFMAGPGWFKDMTHMLWTNWSDFDPFWGIDFAGPAITFGMFNQLSGSSKDLILSATVIPQRDNVREYRRVNSFYQKTAGQTTPHTQSFFPQGFSSFSTPTLVVPGTTTTFFTGSITLETAPYVTVGATTLERREPATPPTASIRRPVPFVQTVVGRGKVGSGLQNLTGRSIFGRTTNAPSLGDMYQINRDLCILSGINDEKLFQVENHTKSPYLLLPNDKLFFSISKWRSAFASESFGTTPDPTYSSRGWADPFNSFPDGTSVWLYQSASHDVKINSGTFSITLYGSLIKEGKETHSTLNSRLDTEEIHEMIGAEPIVDEFDIYYPFELSGSYHNQFKLLDTVPYLKSGAVFSVTGSNRFETSRGLDRIFNTAVYSHVDSADPAKDTRWSNQFRFTNLRNFSEIRKGASRFVNIASKELFWDTRIPDPKETLLVCNPSFALEQISAIDVGAGNGYIATDGGSGGSSGMISTGYVPSNSTAYITGGYSANDLVMTYPYEPKFSNVSNKFLSNLQRDVFPWVTRTDTGVVPNGYRLIDYENISFEIGPQPTDGVYGRTGRYFVGEPQNFVTGTGADSTLRGVGISEFAKIFYGVGKGRNIWDNQHVLFRQVDIGNRRQSCSAILRGWRYGMMSAFPTYSSAVFRRDRYGQMRDMLEQRLNAKFYNEGELGSTLGPLESPVRVKFVNSDGNIVQPYETYSSNLSFEATSSIPYTDGIVKNREEPITLASANQTIVVI